MSLILRRDQLNRYAAQQLDLRKALQLIQIATTIYINNMKDTSVNAMRLNTDRFQIRDLLRRQRL